MALRFFPKMLFLFPNGAFFVNFLNLSLVFVLFFRVEEFLLLFSV